jgi:hypothetical protein
VSHNIVVMTRSPQVEVGKVDRSVPESGRWLERYSSSARLGKLVIYRVRLPVGEIRAKPPSYASDRTVEMTLAMMLPSRYWSWRDIAAESCWRWRCRGDINYGAAESMLTMATWPWRDVAAEVRTIGQYNRHTTSCKK